MGKVRIGFAGVGYMGQAAHLRNYAAIPDCDIVALAEPRQRLARRVADRYHIGKVYQSHLELAEDPDIDAVVASQPHLMNGYIAIPLLRAGKSVFVEKPMAGSLAEAEQMVQAARDGGARLMVGFMKRHDSGVNRGKAELSQLRTGGAMGELHHVSACCFCGDWLRNVPPPITTDAQAPAPPDFVPKTPEWMTSAQQDAFNQFMNIYSHNLNLVRYLWPGNMIPQAAVIRPNGVTLSAILDLDGALVTLFGAPGKAGWWEEETGFHFADGWVRFRTPTPMAMQESADVEVYHGADRQERRTLFGPPKWAFEAQAEHFAACLKSGAPFRADGEDCLEDMRLMETLFRMAL